MTYKEALDYLDSFVNHEKNLPRNYSSDLSLDRITRLLSSLGEPHRRYPAIHVAGTKGKGSTCAFIASILKASGVRTGLYTSPHLLSICERIQVNGEPISEDDFASMLTRIRPVVAPETTYFDLLTACAFFYFQEEGVDAAVVEVGLGGRLDSTNVLLPEVTVITPISLDHMEQLGDTVEAISREKAGIIKQNVPVVLAPQLPEAAVVIAETSAVRRAPLHRVDQEVFVSRLEPRADGVRVSFQTPERIYPEVVIPLLGRHQAGNAITAVRAVELWSRQRSVCGTTVVCRGLQEVVWPGRCQLVQGRPPILLDGAHNAASFEVLRRTVLEVFPGKKVWLVLGISAGKDLAGICGLLSRTDWKILVTRAAVSRAESPEKIAEILREKGNREPAVYESVEKALKQAQSEADPNDLILVSGSLFMVADALHILGKYSTPVSSGAVSLETKIRR